jgi:hypothetical protein
VKRALHFARSYVLEHRTAATFMALAVVARLVFWLTTDRQWEDALITITHARNAAIGRGLVHHLGEGRVHGFTSALSVLVPLVGEAIHLGSGLLAIRLASLASAVVAIASAEAIARRLEISTGPTCFALAYLALDQNQIFYGMAGMETEIAVACLLFTALAILRGEVVSSGLGLGFSLLARPDFVLFAAPALVFMAPGKRLRTSAIMLATVAPWLIFTTLYYGSPVPHTIRAKAAIQNVAPTGEGIGAIAAWVVERLDEHKHDWRHFAPFVGQPPDCVPFPAVVLIAVVFIAAWLFGICALRRTRAAWPIAAYTIVFAVYRVLLLPAFYWEWYQPPFLALCALVAAVGLSVLAKKSPRVSVAISSALALAFALHLPWSCVIEGRIQREVEEPVRKRLGLYLASVVRPGEPVSAECAGYIGFYSSVLLYDYPGLTSPTVRRALESVDRRHRTLCRTIALLRPTWVALRPYEVGWLQQFYPDVAALYEPVQTITAPVEGAAIEWGGLRVVNIDKTFFVLRLRDTQPRHEVSVTSPFR